MSDETRALCPECGTRVERLISSGAGLVFKGSGFYITDYKRAGEAKREGEGTEKGAKKEAGKDVGKSDAKPEKSSSKDSTSSSTSSKGKGADS